MVGDGARICCWVNLWWGSTFVITIQFLRLFRIVIVKNLHISSILSLTYPFSWSFNFCCNLFDLEMEDLERLMSSLTCLYLSPSILDARVQSLSSSELFTIRLFFLVLSNQFDPISLCLTKFVWKSKVPSKAKTFAWLVTHKKVNTNNMLQLKKSYKVFSLDVCLLRMESGETMNHFFLHCLLMLGLWHKLFRLANLDQLHSQSVCDMMTVLYKELGSSIKGKVLWQTTCLTLIWIVWQERNAKFFQEQGEDFKGYRSFLCLLLGLLHHNI